MIGYAKNHEGLTQTSRRKAMPEPNPTHVIFLEWPLGLNSGGPSGYLWHLRQGLEAARLTHLVKFVVPTSTASKPNSSRTVLKLVDSVAYLSDGLWRLLKTYGPTITSKERKLFIRTATSEYFAPTDWERILRTTLFKTFHCHTTFDCIRVHNSLCKLGRRKDVVLYLTSHCPEMPACEKLDIMRDKGLAKNLQKPVLEKLLEIDTYAFSCADKLIIPCEEALEAYIETNSRFADIIKSKERYCLLTGIYKPECGINKISIPKTSTDRLKLVYAGRHNKVKGYDFLCNVIPPLLEKLHACIFVAGRQGPLFAPAHPNWHEFGWISNDHDLISQSDVFILPNTRTYFDIIALQVMSLAIPILATNTGGNKKLASLSPGVILFEKSENGLVSALQKFQSLSRDEKTKLRNSNEEAFKIHFTMKKFAEDYIKIIELK